MFNVGMNKEKDIICNCPRKNCNGKLLKKIDKEKGSPFLGCSNFPECDYNAVEIFIIKQQKS